MRAIKRLAAMQDLWVHVAFLAMLAASRVARLPAWPGEMVLTAIGRIP